MGLTIPTNWTFKNESVAANFDQHVREQLPFYDLVAGAVAHIARHYLTDNGRLYDLGASTGNITSLLEETLIARNIFAVSIDNSSEMVGQFAGYGELIEADITTYNYRPFDVAILFLVLMFLSIPARERLLEELLENVIPGGAIIVVDKEESYGGYFGTVISRLALAGKLATNTSADEIVRKELSLAGVQRPLNPGELPPTAKEFFRLGDFVGYVIEAA